MLACIIYQGHCGYFFQNSLSCTMVSEIDQPLSGWAQNNVFSSPFKMTFIYAKCLDVERQHLRVSLAVDNADNSPWLIGGNFNTIAQGEVKKGGRYFNLNEIVDFITSNHDAQVYDVGFSGSSFTQLGDGIRVIKIHIFSFHCCRISLKQLSTVLMILLYTS